MKQGGYTSAPAGAWLPCLIPVHKVGHGSSSRSPWFRTLGCLRSQRRAAVASALGSACASVFCRAVLISPRCGATSAWLVSDLLVIVRTHPPERRGSCGLSSPALGPGTTRIATLWFVSASALVRPHRLRGSPAGAAATARHWPAGSVAEPPSSITPRSAREAPARSGFLARPQPRLSSSGGVAGIPGERLRAELPGQPHVQMEDRAVHAGGVGHRALPGDHGGGCHVGRASAFRRVPDRGRIPQLVSHDGRQRRARSGSIPGPGLSGCSASVRPGFGGPSQGHPTAADSLARALPQPGAVGRRRPVLTTERHGHGFLVDAP